LTRFRYQEGYLFCCHCDKQYKIEECPYYYEVIKPQLQKDRETIVKWKQKRYSDSPQQQQQQQQQEKDKNTK
jgi:hypothetical protein